MAFDIGINVVEVDGSATPAIPSAAVSVAAFNIVTQRGVPNMPVRVTSFAQFAEQFGSFFQDGLGAYLVKGFFDNGGQTVYINRIAGNDMIGATPASVTLQDTKNVDTILLEGGMRGQANPGTWSNALYVKVEDPAAVDPRVLTKYRLQETAAATIPSTALTDPIDMSALPKLSLLVDGDSQTLDLTFKQSDFANVAQAKRVEIRDAINKQAGNRIVASISSDNKLVLTSMGAGARPRNDWSSLQIAADCTPLGFSKMNDAQFGTPAALATTGTQITNYQDLQVGDVLHIEETSPAPASPRSANVKITAITPATGMVQWMPAVSNIASYTVLHTRFTKDEFNLIVAYGGNQPENIVETWPGLSMEPDVPNYAKSVLNDTISGSRYITAIDKHSNSAIGFKTPKFVDFTLFSTLGSNGTINANDYSGDHAKRTGFYAFDPFAVQLVCCDTTDPAATKAGLDYCAGRGDCMFVGAVPEGLIEKGQAVKYGQSGFQGKKVYGALYGPWIKIADPIGQGANAFKLIPPVGHVMGAFARIETTRGIWKAPAGDEANLRGALDVSYRLTDAEHTDLVTNGSINGIRAVPGAGIVIDASRTLSTDIRWLYVNVRLLFNYVESSLKIGTRWVRQEPNRDTLWNAVKFNSVIPFLTGLWRQGAFGTGAANQVFTVICDASNNPPDQVDQGFLKIEVYFYPSKPAERIIIVVGQQPGISTVSEA